MQLGKAKQENRYFPLSLRLPLTIFGHRIILSSQIIKKIT